MTIHTFRPARRRTAVARDVGPVGRPKLRSDQEQMAIIVGVATELYLEHGYTEMKMSDVAACCAISKRTLYRLFPSKIDLFQAMVEEHRAMMLHFPSGLAERPLDDALAEIFRVDLDDVSDGRRTKFVMRTVEEARQIPEIGDIMHEHGGEQAKRLLAEWLSEWRAHSPRKLANPFAAASILMDMIFGAVVLKQMKPLHLPGGFDRRAYVKECIRCFVNGAVGQERADHAAPVSRQS